MSNSSTPAENIAVCSWSLQPKDTAELVSMVQSLGLNKVQLALNDHRGSQGGAAIGVELAKAGIEIVSGMFGTVGEDYTSMETIKQTGGVIPDEHWEANQQIAKDVVEAARSLGLDLVSFHAGFLPEDQNDPDYEKLITRLRTLATLFDDSGIMLSFETGQEEGSHLSHFLDDLAAPNVGVNFDPANMILYDKGDPIEGLRSLVPYLQQVHIKDANKTKTPGTWGEEVVVGTGEVDWPAFLEILNRANYKGALVIEREAGDDRVADILAAKNHLETLLH
ncbi:sugar phosphate isomerase/epimerase [Opitutia bacterium ISCC 51]|nr:sugar phosphate isomerase/epimerase [Opitutae bacterium ISCC 51]QXD29297.1 sugar phosphate isomerase/epimerase [Opitutae bacterium ISCC 52]